jgi:uncharacterized membrane protein
MLVIRLTPNLEVKPVNRIKFVTQTVTRYPGRPRIWRKESFNLLKKRVEFFSLYLVLYFFIPKIWLHKLLSEEHEKVLISDTLVVGLVNRSV